MTKTANNVLTQALAAESLASDDWERAWQAELDRRAAASDASSATPAEWSEVRARVLGKLASR